MNYKHPMVVQRVLVMDVHSIFSYEHHLLVQSVIRVTKVIEHSSDHVNLVDKKFEKYLIRMYSLRLFHFPRNSFCSYCAIHLSEAVESRSCSMLSIEIQIIIGLFIIIAGILIFLVIFCWRKNRK